MLRQKVYLAILLATGAIAILITASPAAAQSYYRENFGDFNPDGTPTSDSVDLTDYGWDDTHVGSYDQSVLTITAATNITAAGVGNGNSRVWWWSGTQLTSPPTTDTGAIFTREFSATPIDSSIPDLAIRWEQHLQEMQTNNYQFLQTGIPIDVRVMVQMNGTGDTDNWFASNAIFPTTNPPVGENGPYLEYTLDFDGAKANWRAVTLTTVGADVTGPDPNGPGVAPASPQGATLGAAPAVDLSGNITGVGWVSTFSQHSNVNFNYIEILVPPIPGDVEGDGDVDMNDYFVLRDHFSTSVAIDSHLGDLNADGLVDLVDFGEWKSNFPFPGSGGGSAEGFVAPEPSTVLIVLPILLGLGWARFRKERLAPRTGTWCSPDGSPDRSLVRRNKTYLTILVASGAIAVLIMVSPAPAQSFYRENFLDEAPNGSTFDQTRAFNGWNPNWVGTYNQTALSIVVPPNTPLTQINQSGIDVGRGRLWWSNQTPLTSPVTTVTEANLTREFTTGPSGTNPGGPAPIVIPLATPNLTIRWEQHLSDMQAVTGIPIDVRIAVQIDGTTDTDNWFASAATFPTADPEVGEGGPYRAYSLPFNKAKANWRSFSLTAVGPAVVGPDPNAAGTPPSSPQSVLLGAAPAVDLGTGGAGRITGVGWVATFSQLSTVDFNFIEILVPPVPGDVDGDGDVDPTDFNILTANFGTTVAANSHLGDLNGDTLVNIVDFAQWKANYPFPGAGGGSGITSVPEPATALISLPLLFGLGMLRLRNLANASRNA
jgi:hypothetical protein